MKTFLNFFFDNVCACLDAIIRICARPFLACGNCGNPCNAENQGVESDSSCGNCVAICGNLERSVAIVVAIVTIFIYNVSIIKLI